MEKKKASRLMVRKTLSLTLLSLLLIAGNAPIVWTHNAPFPGGYDPYTLTIDTTGFPESLDPAWAYDSRGCEVIQNVYETLMFFNVTYQDGPYRAGKTDSFVPKLATALPTIDHFDPPLTNPKGGLSISTRYTFPIRTDVKFHWNPALTVTPRDVEYSFERVLVQDRAGGPSWLLYEPLLGAYHAESPTSDPDWGLKIDGAVESDSTHVWFNLVASYPEMAFRQILCQTWSSVMSEAWAVNEGDLNIAEVIPVPPSTNPWSNWEYIYNRWWNPMPSYLEDAKDKPFPLKDGGTGPYMVSYYDVPSNAYSIVAWNDHDNNPATTPRYRDEDGDGDIDVVGDGYWDGWPARVKSDSDPDPAKRLGGFLNRVTWNMISSWNMRKTRFLNGISDETAVPRQNRDEILGQVVGGEQIRCYYPLPSPVLQSFFFTFDIETTSDYMGVPQLPDTFSVDGIPPNIFGISQVLNPGVDEGLNVRKAFAHAFNYTWYINAAYSGEGEQPSDPVIKGIAYDNVAQRKYSYNLTEAKYYLKLAWGGSGANLGHDPDLVTPGLLWQNGMRFTVAYGSGISYHQLAAQEIATKINSLNPSKFFLDFLGIDYGTVYLPAMANSELPVFFVTWPADNADPHGFVFPLMHSQGIYPQYQRYSNATVDALVEAGKATHDDIYLYLWQLDAPNPIPLFNNWPNIPPDTRWPRRSTYYALQELYYEDVPSVPIIQPFGRHYEQAWMRGYYWNPLYPGEYGYHRWKALTHMGDVSGVQLGIADGNVGGADLGFLNAHWSNPPGIYRYHPVADVNGGIGATTGNLYGPVRGVPDGRIDMLDYCLVGDYWDMPPGRLHPGGGASVPAPEIIVSVSPPKITELVGETFSVNLVVTSVQGLWSYRFVLRYDTDVLTATDCTNLAYLVDPQFTIQMGKEINDAEGYIDIVYRTSWDSNGFTTTETKPLLSITFQVDTAGISSLNIDEAESYLVDIGARAWIYPYNLKVNDGIVTTPEVAVSPEIIVGPPPRIDETFTVDIAVRDVIDLYAWQAGMTFNPDVLECLSIAEGEFLKRAGVPTLWTPGSIDNTLGTISYSACSITGPTPGVDGDGQLMSITFRVKNSGTSTLHLTDVVLLDSNSDPIAPVNIVDGEVVIHVQDIAILSVTTSASEAYPTWTVPLDVTVVVENQGTRSETFDVTVYANALVIGTRTVTLDASASTPLVFNWDLTGVAEGTYAIRAEATVLYGEIDTADNTLPDGTVTIKHPGDADGNGVLNVYDLAMLAKAWGTKVGEPLYNAKADFNGDGVIDSLDHDILKAHWP